MFAPYKTDEEIIEAAKEAAKIIARAQKKSRQHIITREDDFALTRALSSLNEIIEAPINQS